MLHTFARMRRACSLSISTPPHFGFRPTVFSHGWCALAPFSVDASKQTLEVLLECSDRTLTLCRIAQHSSKQLSISVEADGPIASRATRELKQCIRSCLRLDDDLSAFYSHCRSYPQFRWIERVGAGRMLRAASVFEDIVKMICTTNCSWALTESMVLNLTQALGRPFGDTRWSFPTPQALAGQTEAFVRKEIRAGYRAPFLLELAARVASGNLDVESIRTDPRPTTELFRALQAIKGIGDYAAGNLLKLIGRYDYLGLDSWVRGQYYQLYHGGRKVKDSTIERRFRQHGQWRGLVFWLDMTKQWYRKKFPF